MLHDIFIYQNIIKTLNINELCSFLKYKSDLFNYVYKLDLTNIKEININFILNNLHKFINLKKLNVKNCLYFNDDCLNKVKHICKLNCRYSGITENGIYNLSNITSLKCLNIFTGYDKSIYKNLLKLTKLSYHDNFKYYKNTENIIKQLTNLTKLSIYNCCISTNIINSFTNLKKLKIINCDKKCGEYNFSNLTKLIKLQCYNFDSICYLNNLLNLKKLILIDNYFNNKFNKFNYYDDIKYLNNLIKLKINSRIDFNIFENLNNLVELNCTCNFKNISLSLSNLKKLTIQFEKNVKKFNLTKLTSIKYLTVINNNINNSINLNNISNLTNLINLKLYNCDFNTIELKKLINLEKITLNNCNKIIRLDNIKNIHDIKIIFCNEFTINCNDLNKLTCKYCKNIIIEKIENINSLKLIDNENIIFNNLINVKILNVYYSIILHNEFIKLCNIKTITFIHDYLPVTLLNYYMKLKKVKYINCINCINSENNKIID